MERSEILLGALDRDRSQGIEIGPFYSPVAPKSEGWRTVVVDAFSGDELRSIAGEHSSADVRSRVDKIEDVDVIWRGEPLSSIELLKQQAPFDYVIASHVLEHVPDLVGFLGGISGLLAPSGVASFALPDSRFCFDALRPVTLLGDVLQARREGRTRHSPETVLNQLAYGLHLDGQGAWIKGASGKATLMASLAWAQTQYQDYLARFEADAGFYRDCHAWVFTPSSFELLMLELRGMGLIDLVVVDLSRQTLASEFFVTLMPVLGRPDEHELGVLRLKLLMATRSEVCSVKYSAEQTLDR